MVEVITATVIVSALAAGVFATTSFSKRMDVLSEQRLIAMSKVEERMNDLKRQGAAALAVTLPAGSDPCVFPHPSCKSASCACVQGEMNGTMNGVLSTIIRQPAPGAKDVIVRFDWYDLLGAAQVVSAATFMEE